MEDDTGIGIRYRRGDLGAVKAAIDVGVQHETVVVVVVACRGVGGGLGRTVCDLVTHSDAGRLNTLGGTDGANGSGIGVGVGVRGIASRCGTTSEGEGVEVTGSRFDTIQVRCCRRLVG
jgi:hypothetical protein